MSQEDRKQKLREIFGGATGGGVSDRVVDFHMRLDKNVWDRYKLMPDELIDIVEEINASHQYFTDHGRRHTYRIIDNIAKLEAELDSDFNTAEVYILCCSAWLHDVGMAVRKKIRRENELEGDWFKDIGTTKENPSMIESEDLLREYHHIISWNFVLNNSDELNLIESVSRDIARVCRSHRMDVDIEEVFNNPYQSFPVRLLGPEYDVYLGQVAAIFQLADSLDVDKRRAKELQSEYVKKLPEESKKHWESCQAIRAFKINDVNEIILYSTGKTPDDLEFFRKKVAKLLKEYQVNQKIFSQNKSYNLTIAGVRYEPDKSMGVEPISAKDEMDRLKQESKTDMERKEARKFTDIVNSWEIDIFNTKGDAQIKRKYETKIKDDKIEGRDYYIEADNQTEWNWGAEVWAWDAYGNDLRIEKKEDRGDYKAFKMVFPENMDRDRPYTFWCTHKWESLFSDKDEYFTMNSEALKDEIVIDFPGMIGVENLRCYELIPKKNTGSGKDFDKEDLDANFYNLGNNRYACTAHQSKRESKVKLEWTMKGKGGGAGP
jgi:hypothetical protein